MVRENDAFIINVKFDNSNRDLVTQNELILYLIKRVDLLGFYLGLQWADQVGLLRSISQKALAGYLGMSEPTFIKRRKELEKLGLLVVDIGTGVSRYYKFEYISRIPRFDPPKSLSEIPEYLDKATQSLQIGEMNSGQTSFVPFIPKISPKKVEKRYPKEDYNKVLIAYMKYKGVQLQGNEQNMCLRATKVMFRANRTVDQIVSFMKWLRDVEDAGGYEWTRLWTIWTVQKKLPEFLAGKLGGVKRQEDERI